MTIKTSFSIKNHIKDQTLLQPPQTPKENQTTNKKTFSIPPTTKNKIVK